MMRDSGSVKLRWAFGAGRPPPPGPPPGAPAGGPPALPRPHPLLPRGRVLQLGRQLVPTAAPAIPGVFRLVERLGLLQQAPDLLPQGRPPPRPPPAAPRLGLGGVR